MIYWLIIGTCIAVVLLIFVYGGLFRFMTKDLADVPGREIRIYTIIMLILIIIALIWSISPIIFLTL
jgi:hypothetical protein